MIDHAIEQASRRWRGGYDSAKKRFGRPGSAVRRPKCVDTLARRTRVYNFPFTGLMLLDSNSSDRHLSLCTKIGFRFVLRLSKTGLLGCLALDDQLLCLELGRLATSTAAGSA